MTSRPTLLAAAFVLALGSAHAVTLRVANQGDATSMDPHSLNESLQLAFTGNVYEPLVGRDKQLKLAPMLATPSDTGQGQFNLGSYSNARVDELTLAVQSETDAAKRNAMIRKAFTIHQEEIGHIPLHQQAWAWGAKSNIQLVQLADNSMHYRWVVVK